MPSKVSWFNIEIMKQIARSTGWISIVYFLGLLLILPIRLLTLNLDDWRLNDHNRHVLFQQFTFEFQLAMLVSVPVILAVFLFRFLHVKQSADLMHSLPLKREKIFHHYALTGMVFLLAPVAAITLITIVIHAALDFDQVFSLTDLFYWAGTTSTIAVLLYTATVLIAMMTGISVVHAVLSYIFLFFPFGFIQLLFYNLKILLYGFPSTTYLESQLEKISPLTYATTLNGRVFQWGDAVGYLVAAIIFYVLALLFYQKRNVEQASEAIAIPKLRAIFKYGVTFCTMLVGAAYFNKVSNYSLAWLIFGYVMGAVFGYFIAEMVLQKTWRVFARVKGLAVYAAVVAILVMGVKTLGIYENKVPSIADIQSVQLTNGPLYTSADGVNYYYRMKPLTEQANIATVRKLHQQILDDRNLNRPNNEIESDYFIRYTLKNGRHVTREYRINERLYEDFFKPILESKEYKLAANPLFKVKDSRIKTMNIRANGPSNKELVLSDPQEIKEAIHALREDVLAESYADSLYFQGRGSSIELALEGEGTVYAGEVKPVYLHFIRWLEEKQLLERTVITAEDISHVLVVKGETTNTDSVDELKRELEGKNNSLNIKKNGQIKELLDQASSSSDKEFKAIFYYKFGGYYEIMSFDEEHAPDFVLKHF